MIFLTIERLSDTAVKIVISKREMMSYGVSFETLNENSIETRNMITGILRNMCLNAGINFTSAKLFIEAFSVPENSCILYISVIEDEYEIYEPYIGYVFEFGSISECVGFVRHMSEEIRNSAAASSLYSSDGKKLLLYIEAAAEYEDYIVSSAAEFGASVSGGELFLQYADEHFECIIKENAVRELF